MFGNKLRALFSGILMPIGGFLGKLGISPNFITIISLITGLIGTYYISQGKFLIASIIVIVASLLDVIDGAIAKATNQQTKFGKLLDAFCDKINEMCWFGAFAIYNPALFVASMSAISATMLSSYIDELGRALGNPQKNFGFLDRKDRVIVIILIMFFPDYAAYGLFFIALCSAVIAIQRLLANAQAL